MTCAFSSVPPASRGDDWHTVAAILIEQLKEVYIDGEVEPIDTTNFPRIHRGTSPWVLSL